MPSSDDRLLAFVADATNLLNHMQSSLEDKRVIVRSTVRVDMVIGAHVTRTFLTTRNVLLLAMENAFYDASTLCRSLVELLVSLTFILNSPDLLRACEDFANDGLSHATEKVAALAEHYPENFVLSPKLEARANAIKAFVDDIDYKKKFGNQIKVLQGQNPEYTFKFLDDLIYGDLSQYVHPRAHGLDQLAPERGTVYRVMQGLVHPRIGLPPFSQFCVVRVL